MPTSTVQTTPPAVAPLPPAVAPLPPDWFFFEGGRRLPSSLRGETAPPLVAAEPPPGHTALKGSALTCRCFLLFSPLTWYLSVKTRRSWFFSSPSWNSIVSAKKTTSVIPESSPVGGANAFVSTPIDWTRYSCQWSTETGVPDAEVPPGKIHLTSTLCRVPGWQRPHWTPSFCIFHAKRYV